MRIAHVTTWYVPGLGYEENCLPHEQAKLGHDVIVLTSDRVPRLLMETGHFNQLYPSGRLGIGDSVDRGVRIARLASTPETHGQLLLHGLARRLLAFRPDIVHCHGALTPSTLACLVSQPVMGYGLFIDDHSHIILTNVGSLFRRAYV